MNKIHKNKVLLKHGRDADWGASALANLHGKCDNPEPGRGQRHVQSHLLQNVDVFLRQN